MARVQRTTQRPQAVGLHDIPEELVHSTDWSNKTSFNALHTIIAGIKGQPRLLKILEDQAERIAARAWKYPAHLRPVAHGPARMQGSWVLAYIGHVLSGEPNIQPWHTATKDKPSFWKLCGFPQMVDEKGRRVQVIPAYPTVHQRLTELEGGENEEGEHEGLAEAFGAAVGILMRSFIAQDDR